MAGITFICPCCGKKTKLEIPEIDKLRKEVKDLEKNEGLEMFNSLFGGKK